MNTSDKDLKDIRVRQAIAWAIDRSQLARLIKQNYASPLIGGHIPPTHWAHANLKIYPKRDLKKAKNLLIDAGYHDKIIRLKLLVGSEFKYQVDAAILIKQQLKEVGFDIEVVPQESSLFFKNLNDQNFQMTVVGWLGFVDPDEWTYNLFHSQGKWNQLAYNNTDVDKLLEEGRRALNKNHRREIYKKIQMIIATEAPMAFLYINDQISAHHNKVRDFIVHPTLTTISLRDSWINQ